jgi:cellulose synthase/poly-beta-1,6-N-acetylglucosamine synthase-like glycosyltransferase
MSTSFCYGIKMTGFCIEWGSECSENRQARWTKNIDAEVNIPKDQPPVSVVIVNYNAGLFLTECIHSALPQVNEMLVVDNSSTDLSLDLCIQRFPEEHRLKIIRNSTNLGFAAGCNLGIAQATGAYVLFLNPDCGNNGG